MKQSLLYITAMSCVIAAGALCYKDVGGWGWFLVVAYVIVVQQG